MKDRVKAELRLNFWAILGVTVYAAAFRWFLVPGGLYSGGIAGISQILLHILRKDLHVTAFAQIDLTGIIYWVINVPILMLGYSAIGKRFFRRTLLSITIQALLIAFLPTPSEPLLSDALLNCLIGGALSGLGIGRTLRSGSSCGGTDVLGMYFSKKYRDFSVGRINLYINVFIFTISAFLFNLTIAAYSTVFAIVSAFVTDRMHAQNIKISVQIISSKKELGHLIIKNLKRGVTSWKGTGEYTGSEKYIFMTVISKYELNKLLHLIHKYDEHAFVEISTPRRIVGNYEQRLDA